MAIRVGNEGEMAVVVTARDEASAVVQKFADNAQASMADAQKKMGGSDIAKDPTPWVQAHIKQLETGRQEIDKWNLSAAGLGKALGSAAAALATFAITATTMSLRNADAMGKLAKQANIGTQEFSALAHHFKLSDVNAQGLSRMLFTMERSLGQAARSGKGVTEIIEGLGLKVEDLVKMKPGDTFLALADALSKVEDPYQRAESLQKIFGMSSRSMAEALEGGSAAIRKSMEEARALGAVIDENTAADADKFFDNMTKLSTALGSVGNSLAAGLSKDLVQLSNALVALAKDNAGLKAFGIVLRGIAEVLVFVAKVLATVITAVAAVARDIGDIVGGIAAAFDAIKSGKFKEGANILKDMMEELGRRGKETAKTLGELWGLIEQAPDKVGKSGSLVKSALFAGGGGEFIRTGGQGGGLHMWSDVLPGAELVSGNEEVIAQEEAAMTGRESRERAHLERRLDQWQQYYEARQQFVFRYESLNLQSMEFFFSQLGALMTVKSKAMFNIGKAGAIAETVIQTYKAAQGAYAALAHIPIVGPALGAAAAAAAIVSGFARVQAIRSTQYGGAQGSPVLSGGGLSGPVTATGTGVALPAPPAIGAGAAAAPARVLTITLIGNAFSAQSIRDELIPLINDAIGDGVRLNVVQA